MKAIGYVRVSTEEQATEGVSLDAQIAKVTAYCTLRGLELVDIIVDAGVCGATALADRPGGAQVAELVKRHKVEAVVAFKLDRLFRDAADCLVVTKGWDKANVALHLVDLGGQAIDTSSTMGRFFLTMMAGVAEMERNMIRDRTAMAMARKQERGEYTGGQVPFGWRVADDGIHLTPDAAEQHMIATARRWQADGLSLRKIGAALTADGYLPRGGGAWAASSVKRLLAAEVAA